MPQVMYPANLDIQSCRPCSPPVLLSQGEVRPGIKQGQHWGVPPSTWTEPTPPLVPRIDVNTEIR